MECGHVAPSCARRCAGSRLPDHARCSFFVRSQHRARVRPRRSIHLPAGSMWRAHQHSHKHVWPRTTFNKGGHETIRQRGRHRPRIFYATHVVSVHLTQPRARLWARSASGQQRPFCQHCSQHAATALPRLPCRTPPRCSLLCRGRAPSAALCTGRREIPVLAWPARPPSPALYVCVCVCWVV